MTEAISTRCSGPSKTDVRRSLFSSTSRIAPLTLLSGVANGLTAIVTARHFGPAGRGEVVLVVTVVNVTALILSLGINTAVRYHLVSRSQSVTLPEYFSLAAVLVSLEAFVAVGITQLSLRAIGTPLDWPAMVLVGLLGCAFQGAYLVRDVLNAYGHIVQSAALYAAGAWASALGILGLVLIGSLTVSLVIALLVVGASLELCCCLVFLRRRGRSLTLRWRSAASMRLLTTGLPALGINAGQSLTFRLDRYLIGLLLGASPVGVYSVAATLSELFRTIPAAFGQAVFYRAATGTGDAVSMARARARLLLLMLVPLTALGTGAPKIVSLLFGPQYSGAVGPLRILLLGELAVMSFQIDSRLLSGWGRTMHAGISGLIGLVIVALLDFALIPRWGLLGAAAASVFAYAALGLSARYFVLRDGRTPNAPLRQ